MHFFFYNPETWTPKLAWLFFFHLRNLGILPSTKFGNTDAWVFFSLSHQSSARSEWGRLRPLAERMEQQMSHAFSAVRDRMEDSFHTVRERMGDGLDTVRDSMGGGGDPFGVERVDTRPQVRRN